MRYGDVDNILDKGQFTIIIKADHFVLYRALQLMAMQ
jgi:hypothetical protein